MSTTFNIQPDFKDAVVIAEPSFHDVLKHIRSNFEQFVTGKKTRVIILLRAPAMYSQEHVEASRELITKLGFSLSVSTTRYVLLERNFHAPLDTTSI